MKSILLIIALLATTAFTHAKPKDSLEAARKEFEALDSKQREEHINFFVKARGKIQEKKYLEALEEISQAEKIFSKNEAIHTIRGTCFTEMGMYDRAMGEFDAGLALNPDSLTQIHNRGEILFATHQWKEAHDSFSNLLERMKEAKSDNSYIEFKLLLCKMKLGKNDEVKALSEKYTYMDDTPFYYYTQAAFAYEKGDETDAAGYLMMATRVFPNANLLEIWNDPLIILGYMKNLARGKGDFDGK